MAMFIMSLHGFIAKPRGEPTTDFNELVFYLGVSLLAMLIGGLFLSQGYNKFLWFLVGTGIAVGQLKSQYNRLEYAVLSSN